MALIEPQGFIFQNVCVIGFNTNSCIFHRHSSTFTLLVYLHPIAKGGVVFRAVGHFGTRHFGKGHFGPDILVPDISVQETFRYVDNPVRETFRYQEAIETFRYVDISVRETFRYVDISHVADGLP